MEGSVCIAYFILGLVDFPSLPREQAVLLVHLQLRRALPLVQFQALNLSFGLLPKYALQAALFHLPHQSHPDLYRLASVQNERKLLARSI